MAVPRRPSNSAMRLSAMGCRERGVGYGRNWRVGLLAAKGSGAPATLPAGGCGAHQKAEQEQDEFQTKPANGLNRRRHGTVKQDVNQQLSRANSAALRRWAMPGEAGRFGKSRFQPRVFHELIAQGGGQCGRGLPLSPQAEFW
jgi:hypothetical protein